MSTTIWDLDAMNAPADQGDEGVVHVVCTNCNPDKALCGSDRTGMKWVHEATETGCVVCADLEWEPCPGCGE